MTATRRKKSTRRYGTTRHSGMRRRGSGNRGGVGRAGLGKRAKQKKHKYIGEVRNVGFTSHHPKEQLRTINISYLNSHFEEGKEIDLTGYKVLSKGVLTKKLKIKANKFSKKAAEKIRAAGGEAIHLSPTESAEEDEFEAVDEDFEPSDTPDEGESDE